jgi:DNA ligase 1
MILLLDILKSCCIEINTTNKTIEKIKILKQFVEKNPSLIKLLQYVYDPLIVFNVTSKNVDKYMKTKYHTKKNTPPSSDDIFFLLNQLVEGHWTGNQALENICHYIEHFLPQSESNILYNILDKNLKIRISKNILQTQFPDYFASFHVSLANNYDEKFFHNKKENNWFLSRKLDGVRCLCIIEENGSVSLLSRNQKPFHTLSLLKEEIQSELLDGVNIVYDGEIIDNYQNNSFKKIMEQISRKNYHLDNFEFRIFDCIPLQDFKKGSSLLTFSQRLDMLRKKLSKKNLTYCKILEQYPYTEESFSYWKDKMKEKNWEGLMLRRDTSWEGKRTNNLLKYKIMHDEEYTVIDVDFGKFRVINKETQLEEEIECLTSVTIDYHQTKVGSGFSIEERIKFYNDPELILNKKITVQFFEKNKQSLRFPVFKSLHHSL